MEYPSILGHVNVHLGEDTALKSRRTKNDSFYTALGGKVHDGFDVTLFGSVADMRRLAEEIHRMADQVERESRRQRALDNAPAYGRSRFVLEGEEVSGFKRAA